jgi:outer membrane protein assembly factor BamB
MEFKRTLRWLAVSAALLLPHAALAQSPADQQHWTSFRNEGASTSAGPLPTDWNPSSGILWERELAGYGQSSPVVHGARVFVTSVVGPMKGEVCITCLDLHDGTEQWTYRQPAASTAPSNWMQSRAAPTPCIDAEGVYAFFEGGNLLCLSHRGELRWRRDLAAEVGPFDNNHGLATSPAQTDNLLFLNLEHRGPSQLLAIDKQTGQTRWQVERSSGISWTSPIVVPSDQGEQLIVSSSGSVTSYAAATGERLWTLDGLEGNSMPSPVFAQEHLLIGARLSTTGTTQAAARSNLCLQLADSGVEVAWRASRVVCDSASPVVTQGCVYFVDKAGVLTCADLTTGLPHYSRRLGFTCWATPLVTDLHVYLFGRNGETHVIEAGPRYKLAAVNSLWDVDDPPRPASYVEHVPAADDHTSSAAPDTVEVESTQRDGRRTADDMVTRWLEGDADGDELLTRDELPARVRGMFAEADHNADGRLDVDELTALASSVRQRREESQESSRDPIVYAIAAARGVLLVRTGRRLYAIGGDAVSHSAGTRRADANPTVDASIGIPASEEGAP